MGNGIDKNISMNMERFGNLDQAIYGLLYKKELIVGK